MTTIALQFTAELVKIIDIKLSDNFETEGKFFFLNLICSGCEDPNANKNTISFSPSGLLRVKYKNEYMEVHAYTECKDCGTFGIIQMRPDLLGNSSPVLTAELSRAGKSVTLAHFYMEGLKPTNVSIKGNFVATTEEEDQRKVAVPFNRGKDFVEPGGSGVAVHNMKLGFCIVDDGSSSSAS